MADPALVLTVARLGLRGLLRDRTTLVLAFALPVLLVVLFALVLGTAGVNAAPPPELAGLERPWTVYYLAALAAMFLLFTAARGAELLLDEEEAGFLARLHLAPIAGGEILLGKAVALAAVAFAELLLLVATGELALRLHLDLAARLSAVVAVAAGAAFAAGAIGLLVAAVAPSRRALTPIAALVILVLSALGGSIVPHALLPPALDRLGSLTYNRVVIAGLDAALGDPRARAAALVHGGALALAGAALLAAALPLWDRRLRRGRARR